MHALAALRPTQDQENGIDLRSQYRWCGRWAAGSIIGRHAGTIWAALYAAAWIIGVFYWEVIADSISLSVAGAALVAFGSAKVLQDVTGFLERPEVRTSNEPVGNGRREG